MNNICNIKIEDPSADISNVLIYVKSLGNMWALKKGRDVS